MAITKILHQKANPGRELGLHTKQLIAYIMNPDKTEECILTGSINCLPDTAYAQMLETKKMFGKIGGRQSYHVIISLVPGEGTPDQLYEMTEKFAAEFLGGEYEAVFAVHTDHEHLHSHLVFNSVNMVTGKKFQYKNGDWKYKMQPITNKLSEEYGLEIMPAEYSEDPKNMSRVQWEKEKSISELIAEDAKYCLMMSDNREHYIYLLKELGYEVKNGEHIAVKVPGMKRFKRLGTIAPELDYKMINNIRDALNGEVRPKYIAVDPRRIRRAKLSPLQKKYYYRLYKLRLVQKRRFEYKTAQFYKDLRLFKRLQEEYLLLSSESIENISDLNDLKDSLEFGLDYFSYEQKLLYKDRATVLKYLENDKSTEGFREEAQYEEKYRTELEYYKRVKKELRDKLRIVNNILTELDNKELYKDLDELAISENEWELDAYTEEEAIPPMPCDHPDRTKETYSSEEIAEGDRYDKQDIEAEMIAVDAVIGIRECGVEVMDYFDLSVDERASLWDLSKYGESLGFEAYRKFVTSIKPEWSVTRTHEEYRKHMAKCEELKEEPWMRMYYLERLKNASENKDKVLVREKRPHIR